VVLSIFQSVDTATCAASVRAFNEQAAGLDNTTVVCVSADLPPAAARFCGAEGIENVVTGSTYRNPELLNTLGLRMVDGLLAGLAARAVLVIDANGVVQHSQLVAELSEEPDYDAALAALRS
jgi:thiol peroxidase